MGHSGGFAGYGADIAPGGSHLTYEITDFDESIYWGMLSYLEVRITNATIVQHEATMSERSSPLIASTSSLTAIAQESIQVFTYGKNPERFLGTNGGGEGVPREPYQGACCVRFFGRSADPTSHQPRH